jgi:hypothetical protein
MIVRWCGMIMETAAAVLKEVACTGSLMGMGLIPILPWR